MELLRFVRHQWDRVGAWTLIGIGGLFIIVGWVGAGREALTAQQIPYIISGGIGGLFLLGVGAMLWLSADLRDEWRKLDAIERQARRPEDEVAAPAPEPDPFSTLASNGRETPTPTGTPPRRRTPLTPR